MMDILLAVLILLIVLIVALTLWVVSLRGDLLSVSKMSDEYWERLRKAEWRAACLESAAKSLDIKISELEDELESRGVRRPRSVLHEMVSKMLDTDA